MEFARFLLECNSRAAQAVGCRGFSTIALAFHLVLTHLDHPQAQTGRPEISHSEATVLEWLLVFLDHHSDGLCQ